MGSGPHVRAETRKQIREFLTTRRARLSPGQAGLPAVGGTRRVKGLRREEVAALAGISVEYYIRLERGDAGGVSESVLATIGRALRLSDAERAHLVELLRAGGGIRPCELTTAGPGLRPPVQRILDSMTTTPALVFTGRLDVLGANALGRALHPGDGNIARFVFLDPAARTFWRDWDAIADDCVNLLRVEAGRNPCDQGRSDLIDDLSARSGDFRERWARHDVRVRASGVRRLHHPLVGDLELPFESTPLVADPGQTLLIYTAEPGSPSADALTMLASWTAVSSPR